MVRKVRQAVNHTVLPETPALPVMKTYPFTLLHVVLEGVDPYQGIYRLAKRFKPVGVNPSQAHANPQ
jgi:hypothetical protein